MVLGQIVDKVYSREADEVTVLVTRALEEGMGPVNVLNEGLLASMNRVGHDFKTDVLFLPEGLASARAMHAGMEILRPLLSACEGIVRGASVIGTVNGDLHDIGKNLVGISVLLTTTMGEMEKTIRFLEKAGLRDEEFAQRIGADAYGHDAAEAVNLAREWLQAQES